MSNKKIMKRFTLLLAFMCFGFSMAQDTQLTFTNGSTCQVELKGIVHNSSNCNFDSEISQIVPGGGTVTLNAPIGTEFIAAKVFYISNFFIVDNSDCANTGSSTQNCVAGGPITSSVRLITFNGGSCSGLNAELSYKCDNTPGLAIVQLNPY